MSSMIRQGQVRLLQLHPPGCMLLYSPRASNWFFSFLPLATS